MLKTIILSLILSISSFPVWSCSYQVNGINIDNLEAMATAMKSITPEFNIDQKSGEVHFHSKNAVTKKQVVSALEKSGLENLEVVPLKNKH